MNIPYYFLMAAVALVGFCPSFMAVSEENKNCHREMVMGESIEQKEVLSCYHLDFFGDTAVQNFLDIQIDDIYVSFLFSGTAEVREYSIKNKITPQLFPIPPPTEWQRKKKNIIMRV